MPNRNRRVNSIAFAILACATLHGRIVRADTPSPGTAEPSASPDARMAQLIVQLGDEQWLVREKAAAELERFGEAAFGALQAEFARSERFEVRDRIKRVAYEIHMTQRFGPVRAFLGVSHSQFDATYQNEFRLPPGWTGLTFTDVIPEAAAAKAGIQRNDLLLGLNGIRGSSLQPATEFIRWIGQQVPGTVCHMTVYTGGSGRILNRTSMNGFDPRGFSRATTRVVSWQEDRRLADASVGLELTDVARADDRLDLKVGDMIVALDGQLLYGESAIGEFEKWTKNEPQPPEENDGRNLDSRVTPSIQIVRGGEVVDIDVTLTSRPWYLQGGRAFQRNMINQNRPKKEYLDAELEFEAFWNDKFRQAGVSSDRLDAEAFWRLESK